MSVALRAYCPYGHHQNQASPAFMLGFNGEQYDPLTRMYTLGLGYRNYSPGLMRFTAPDSLSPFDAGGVNAYGYCAGDPVNYADPSGHVTKAMLILGKQRLKPTNTPTTQTPKTPVKKQKVYGHIVKKPEAQSLTETAPDTLQLSRPTRRPVKGHSQSILSNPVLRENTYQERRAYYAFVNNWFENARALEQLRTQLKPSPALQRVLSEINSIQQLSFLLRDNARNQYPYTDL